MQTIMEYTGERMVPEKTDVLTFWEHIYRYKFATKFVRGKSVLDVACGEGYGTAALAAAGAVKVVGIDVSDEAVRHAVSKYGVDARQADGTRIPIDDATFDVVVSFETVEHIPDAAAFVAECARLLKPEGLLVMSTPNMTVYDEDNQNPFHCSEMTEAEFTDLLGRHFTGLQIFSQGTRKANWWNRRSLSLSQSFVRRRVPFLERIAASRCPQLAAKDLDSYRSDPIGAILAEEKAFADFFNPHVVRPRRTSRGETYCYLVAVARKRS